MKRKSLFIIAGTLFAMGLTSCNNTPTSSSSSSKPSTSTSVSTSSSSISSATTKDSSDSSESISSDIGGSSESSSSSVRVEKEYADISSFTKYGYGLDDASVSYVVGGETTTNTSSIKKGTAISINVSNLGETTSQTFYLYVGDEVISSKVSNSSLTFEFNMPGYDVDIVLAPSLGEVSETGSTVTISIPEHVTIYGYKEGDKYDVLEDARLYYKTESLGYLLGISATYSNGGTIYDDNSYVVDDEMNELYAINSEKDDNDEHVRSGDLTLEITCEYKGTQTITFSDISIISSVKNHSDFAAGITATIGSTVKIRDIIPNITSTKFAFTSASITYGGNTYSSMDMNDTLMCATKSDGSIELIKFTMPSEAVSISLDTVNYHSLSLVADETKIKNGAIKAENTYSGSTITESTVDSLVYLWIEPMEGYIPTTVNINGKLLTKTDTSGDVETENTIYFAQNSLHPEYYTLGFNMLDADVSIEVNFTTVAVTETYALTYTSSDANGNSVKFYDKEGNEITSGSKIESSSDFLTYYFVPTAGDGYQFDNKVTVTYSDGTTKEWSTSDETLSSFETSTESRYYFKMPADSVTITPSFSEKTNNVSFYIGYDTNVSKINLTIDGVSKTKLALNKTFEYAEGTKISVSSAQTKISGKKVVIKLTYADETINILEPTSTETNSFSGATTSVFADYTLEANLTKFEFVLEDYSA